jgi:threonyl-tRNA synthetase
LDFCRRVAEELGKFKIRIDIDDRPESVQRKVRDAEREWVPYIVVIGDQEVESGELQVRLREKRTIKRMGVKELGEEVSRRTKEMPFEPLCFSRELSARPIFVGA